MSSIHPDKQGITLAQAALIAGLGLLIMVVVAPPAEFLVYSKLIVRDDVQTTIQNIQAHEGLFVAGILGYGVVFICDVIVAWALYVLFIPVNRSLSLLTAWFRLVYTVIAFVALSKLVTVYHLLSAGDYLTAFGPEQTQAQVQLLLRAFRHEWNTGLILFGIHLCLLAYLVYRSGYIPKIMAVFLGVAGSGWLISEIGPYLFPDADFGLFFIAYTGEIVFMLWLLIRGWKIQPPST